MRTLVKGLWRLLVLVCIFGLVYSAAALYRVKVDTRQTERAINALEKQRETLLTQIDALDTEWAFLNAPENLNLLIGLYAGELNLRERVPDSFARLSELPTRGAGVADDGLSDEAVE